MDDWNGGDDGNGWDDEDDLGDLSDQSLGEGESKPVNDTEVIAPTHTAPPPPPPPPPPPAAAMPGPGVELGSGMFMGRLTKFIDSVTKSEDVEEGDGWNDDSALDNLGLDDGDGQDDQGNGWDDDMNDLVLADAKESSPTKVELPVSLDAKDPQLKNSGWEEDLDLQLDESPQMSQGVTNLHQAAAETTNNTEEVMVIPLKGDTKPITTKESGDVVVDRTPPGWNRSVSFNASMAVLGGNSVTSLDLEPDAAQINLSNTPVITVTNDMQSGWDDDENILETADLDADPEDSTKVAVSQQVQDHTPPPPPPLPPPPPPLPESRNVGETSTTEESTPATMSGWDADDALTQEVEEDTTKMGDYKPPAAAVQGASKDGSSGWDDDEVDFDDDDLEAAHTGDRNQTLAAKALASGVALVGGPGVGANNSSLTETAPQVETSGWEDDVGLLDDQELALSDNKASDEAVSKLVDHTPPPPPIKLNRMTTMEAICGNDSIGEDDLSQADTLSLSNSRGAAASSSLPSEVDRDSLHLVDLTPPLPLPPRSRAETADAVASDFSMDSNDYPESGYQSSRQQSAEPSQDLKSGWDEDSSLDQVLGQNSQANSVEVPRKLVDHTPPPAPPRKKDFDSGDSMAVLGAASSISESVDSLDDARSSNKEQSKSKFGLRKMVDHTPTPSRLLHRGISLDASLAVLGASSVGESLDSIDEEDEEPESPLENERPKISTPVNIAAGWSVESLEFSEEKPRNALSVSIEKSMAIPFGASSHSTEIPNAGNIAETKQVGGPSDKFPVVDQTPLPLPKSLSVATSIEVAGGQSVADDFDESHDGVDTVKEDLYGQVVDHTPGTRTDGKQSDEEPRPSEKMDDTVQGVAENKDVDADIKQDDDMDESSQGESTHGTSLPGTLEDHDMRSLLGSIRLCIVEEDHLVDHVPESKGPRPADASTLVLADASEESSRDDNVVNDDSNTLNGFGPVVDHTPSVRGSALSVATSVVTQVSALEADLKMDEDLDNTVGPGASADDVDEGAEGWDHDEPDLEGAIGEFDEAHLVDHVPNRRGPCPRFDASTRALKDPSDESTGIPDEATVEGGAENCFGPVVDQTPRALSVGHSVAASMATQITGLDVEIKQDEDMDNTFVGASTAGGSGWDHEEPDLEDLSATDDQQSPVASEENHMVDHVPQQPLVSRPTDASTMVLIDQTDVVSAVEDDENDENVRSSRFGPVVDQTPAIPPSAQMSIATSLATHASGIDTEIKHDDDMDGTWFGASTAGGASTSGGDGWDDDERDLEDLEELASSGDQIRSSEADENHLVHHVPPAEEDHLVDHIPPLTDTRGTNASTASIADPSEVSSHVQEGSNENIGAGGFGAVVDHTPSEPRLLPHSVQNSMTTHVTGLETDIKRDDEMDETWNGGISSEGADGWDQDEPELEELADNDDDQLPHLVDHVPERPESRPTDASTLVVADPSEMLSQVDDFGQEEQNFGPVVDQTPVSQQLVPQSGAGSTIVAPPSVVDDDLDDAVETAGDGTDQNGWDHDDIDTIDEAPNPQSGNEDEANREQLVDYLPPEDEMPELIRDGSSEMATVGEKSVLPTDDPKEDEFGPVVDHTPQPERSPPRVSEQKALRPDVETKNNMDSVAVIFSVASDEDKNDGLNDGLDDDEFGPVVDHLPTGSSRSSFPPSRGGSTVDALATVSEVDDDEIDGDGWEEDTEIDVSEQAASAVSGRPGETPSGEDKNLSVKWVDALGKRGVATSAFSRSAVRQYDPQAAESNVWGSRMNLEDDGDDTPPSTPRPRVDANNIDDIERGILIKTENFPRIPLEATVERGVLSCETCSSASTTDCPCVKRLIDANNGKDAMVGNLLTPEGDYVKVDFEKLLQTEVTKRRLVEKEVQALRLMIESLKSSKESLVASGQSQMEVLNKLHHSNKELTKDLKYAQGACDALRLDNEQLRSDATELKAGLSELAEQQDNWRAEEALLKEVIERTRDQMQKSAISTSRDFKSRERLLRAEVQKCQQANSILSERFSKYEAEVVILKKKNMDLSGELETSQSSLANVEEERAGWRTKESALNAEIEHLQGSLEKATGLASSDVQLREQIGSLQSELATKTGECVELKSQTSHLQQRLQASEADNFKHAKELARTVIQHDDTTANLKDRIEKSETQLEKARLVQKQSEEEFGEKLASANAALEGLKTRNNSLEKERQHLTSSHEQDIKGIQNNIQQKESKIRDLELKLRNQEKERLKLTSDLWEQRQLATKAESLTVELRSVKRERDVLKEALIESKETSAALQKQVSAQDSEGDKIASRRELEISGLRQEREGFTAEIASFKEEIQDLKGSLDSALADKGHLEKQLGEVKEKSKSLEVAAEQRTLVGIKYEAKAAKMQNEIKSLHERLRAASGERQTRDGDRERLAERCAQLESGIERLQADASSQSEECKLLRSQLSEERDLVKSMEVQLDRIAADRDRYVVQCREIESNSSTISEASKRTEHDLRAYKAQIASLGMERDNAKNDLLNLQQVLHDRENKANALRRDLAEARKLVVEKDKASGVVEEQQKKSRMDFEEILQKNTELRSRVVDRERAADELEKERNDLLKVVEEHTANKQYLNTKLIRVEGERDAFARERDMLEDDNEEMLVQFGLLKEQMDASDDHLRRLQEEVKAREAAAQDAERKFENSEKRLGVLSGDMRLVNGSGQSPTVSGMEHSMQQLMEENSNLQKQVANLSLQNENVEARYHSAGSEKKELLKQVQELQSKVDELVLSGQKKEQQLATVIEDMEVQYRNLHEKCCSQEEDLAKLSELLKDSQAKAQEVSELRSRVEYLHHTVSEQERTISTKNSEMKALQRQLQIEGKIDESVVSLRQTIHAMENAANKGRARIRELESICGLTKSELGATKEKLLSTEEAMVNLKKDLGALKKESMGKEKMGLKLRKMEMQLSEKATHVTRLKNESSNLQNHITSLECKLEEKTYGEAQKLQVLQMEVESLKEQQKMSSSQIDAREAHIEEEVHALQEAMATKDSQIGSLESQLGTISLDLSNSRHELASKCEDVHKLTVELEELRQQAQQSTPRHLLDVTHEEAESVEQMRSSIVSLATALEQSEIRRAEAIERLEKERLANANSLHQMTESVKRFYSTLSCGDV